MSDIENEQRNKEKSAPKGKQKAVLKAGIESLKEIRDPKIEINQQRIEALATEGRGRKKNTLKREI